MNLSINSKAVIEERTIHTKYIKDPKNSNNILKPARNNKKLGKGKLFIKKGRWKGQPLFSLSLEERKTCPRSCFHYLDCYGNTMPYADRYEHGIKLESRLNIELKALSKKYPNGFVIRLHGLGDFYSVRYVNFWRTKLIQYPNLNIYGFTARTDGDEITDALKKMRFDYPLRWWIRFSTSKKVGRSKKLIYAVNDSYKKDDAISCPEMQEKTESCLTCGLCFQISRPILFTTHN